jgi:hypothetical protein
MTTLTITLNNDKEASLLITLAKKLLSVRSIKSDGRNLAVKGEPMDLKEFRAMIKKSEKSGFISAEQLEENMKQW